jgi:hypothetical protein
MAGHGDAPPRSRPHRLSASYFSGRAAKEREVGCGAVRARSQIFRTGSCYHSNGRAATTTLVRDEYERTPDFGCNQWATPDEAAERRAGSRGVSWQIIAEIVAVCALITVATLVWFRRMGARYERGLTELQERLGRGERSRRAGLWSSESMARGRTHPMSDQPDENLSMATVLLVIAVFVAILASGVVVLVYDLSG